MKNKIKSPIIHDQWTQQTDDMETLKLEICVTRGLNDKGKIDYEVTAFDYEGNELARGKNLPSNKAAKEFAEKEIIKFVNALK